MNSALFYRRGVIKHARRAQRVHSTDDQQLQAPGPGLRGAVLLAYSSRNRSASWRIPYGAGEKASACEFRFPDALAKPLPSLIRRC